jgi:hypothetical protein
LLLNEQSYQNFSGAFLGSQRINLEFSMCLPAECSSKDVVFIATVFGEVLGLNPKPKSLTDQETLCTTDKPHTLNGLDIFAM